MWNATFTKLIGLCLLSVACSEPATDRVDGDPASRATEHLTRAAAAWQDAGQRTYFEDGLSIENDEIGERFYPPFHEDWREFNRAAFTQPEVQAALEEVEAAAAEPPPVWGDFDLSQLRHLANLLGDAALLAADDGDHEAALDHVATQLKLTDLLASADQKRAASVRRTLRATASTHVVTIAPDLPGADVPTEVIDRLIGDLLAAADEHGDGEDERRAAVNLRAAAVTLAVAVYRRAHGEPPATLADLVPDHLPAVPADPLDPAGGPLGYFVLAWPDGSPRPIASSLGSDGRPDASASFAAGGPSTFDSPAYGWTAHTDPSDDDQLRDLSRPPTP